MDDNSSYFCDDTCRTFCDEFLFCVVECCVLVHSSKTKCVSTNKIRQDWIQASVSLASMLDKEARIQLRLENNLWEFRLTELFRAK